MPALVAGEPQAFLKLLTCWVLSVGGWGADGVCCIIPKFRDAHPFAAIPTQRMLPCAGCGELLQSVLYPGVLRAPGNLLFLISPGNHLNWGMRIGYRDAALDPFLPLHLEEP